MSPTVGPAYGSGMNRARGAGAPDESALPLWARRAPAWFDVVVGTVAAGAALASLLGTEPAAVDARLAEPNLFAAVVTVVGALGLVWRRTHPWRGFLLLAAAGVVVSATRYYIGLLSVLLIVAVFSVAAHGRRIEGVASLAVSVLALIGLALAGVPDLRLSDLGQSFALLLAAWAVGDAIRSRRAQQRSGCVPQSRKLRPRANRPPGPSPRSGCGSPGSCTTWSRTACR